MLLKEKLAKINEVQKQINKLDKEIQKESDFIKDKINSFILPLIKENSSLFLKDSNDKYDDNPYTNVSFFTMNKDDEEASQQVINYYTASLSIYNCKNSEVYMVRFGIDFLSDLGKEGVFELDLDDFSKYDFTFKQDQYDKSSFYIKVRVKTIGERLIDNI